jgi:hypothetical protein
MNDASLEAECFGGTYKANVYEQCKSFYNVEMVKVIRLTVINL